jgi:hypothetical protein
MWPAAPAAAQILPVAGSSTSCSLCPETDGVGSSSSLCARSRCLQRPGTHPHSAWVLLAAVWRRLCRLVLRCQSCVCCMCGLATSMWRQGTGGAGDGALLITLGHLLCVYVWGTGVCVQWHPPGPTSCDLMCGCGCSAALLPQPQLPCCLGRAPLQQVGCVQRRDGLRGEEGRLCRIGLLSPFSSALLAPL